MEGSCLTCNAFCIDIALLTKELAFMLTNLFRRNRLLARKKWGSEISSALLDSLRSYGNEFGFSIAAGDLLLLGGGWFVTHAGLLHLARRNRCHGIEVQPIEHLCDAGASRFAFRATVYKSANSQGFVGCGDADPSNVSPRVRGAEMRVAETRAVNRALRKAYGIGLSSIEELGTHASEGEPPIHASKRPAQSAVRDGHANQNSASLATVPCVRDPLCHI